MLEGASVGGDAQAKTHQATEQSALGDKGLCVRCGSKGIAGGLVERRDELDAG